MADLSVWQRQVSHMQFHMPAMIWPSRNIAVNTRKMNLGVFQQAIGLGMELDIDLDVQPII